MTAHGPVPEGKKVPYFGLLVYSAFLALPIGVASWEYKQPVREFKGANVTDVQFYGGRNEFGLDPWYQVRVEESKKPINFSWEDWDPTVKTGDKVDIAAKPRIPVPVFGDDLTGISIDDHK
jgi:hypothetical protein